MKTSDFQFCLHNGSVREDDPKYTLITWCPVEYWQKKQCLPDYNFADDLAQALPNYVSEEVENIPEGYQWYICVEETQWASDKSPQQIRTELTQLGFTESKEMEDFLTPLWP